MTPPSSRLLTCRLCGCVHDAVPLAPGQQARCVRCDGLLLRAPRLGPATVPALALTGLILAVPAAVLPFMTVDKLGNTRTGGFSGSVTALLDHDMPLMSVWVLFCGGVLPVLLLAALLPGLRRPGWVDKLLHTLGHWAMPEVYLLAVLVALTRLGSLVDVEINAGFWCYVAMSVALALAWRTHELQPQPASTGAPARP